MCKVNFKPLWPEAIQALATLSQRYADTVWTVTSRQLFAAATRGSDLYVARKPDWALAATAGEAAAELVFDEQALRDWHLEERRALLRKEESRFEGGVEATAAREEGLIAVRPLSSFSPPSTDH
jgi:U3 small nucleolar RNA-associated protein 20